MTKYFVGPAEKVDAVAPSGGVTAGVGYVLGDGLFVVAEGDADEGETFVGIRGGEHLLTVNASDAATFGNRAWWDDSAKEVLNATAVGAFAIGVFGETRGAAAGRVRVIVDAVRTVAE